MDAATRGLHEGIDAAMRRTGVPYLHPDGETIQLDLLGSGPMVRWQERKQELMFLGSACWSEQPQIYGRYGTTVSRRLLAWVRELEGAEAAVLTDTGMQACALLFDAVLEPGDHVACARGVYNKSKAYLSRLTTLLGGELTLVDDLSHAGLAAALRPETRLLFVETYTNPLMRAVDPEALARAVGEVRAAGGARLVVALDSTIASPWGLAEPALRWEGVDVAVVSGTKALAGQDRDMWGYLASDDVRLLNGVMDLQAMRGGIADWRRATAILDGLDQAEPRFRRRCATARAVTAFLAAHPLVEAVFHPTRARPSGRRGDRPALHRAGLDRELPAARRRRGRDPPFLRRAGDVRGAALRAELRRAGHQAQPPSLRVGVLHRRGGSPAHRRGPAGPAGDRRRASGRPDRLPELGALAP